MGVLCCTRIPPPPRRPGSLTEGKGTMESPVCSRHRGRSSCALAQGGRGWLQSLCPCHRVMDHCRVLTSSPALSVVLAVGICRPGIRISSVCFHSQKGPNLVDKYYDKQTAESDILALECGSCTHQLRDFGHVLL